MKELDYYIPLDIASRICYRSWVREILQHNTLFINPDPFVHARCAALVVYNFVKIFPESLLVIVSGDADTDLFRSQLLEVGVPDTLIYDINDSKTIKVTHGVIFASARMIVAALVKGALTSHDLKLIVIPDARKSTGKIGSTRLVEAAMKEQKQFRVFACATGLPKEIAKVQQVMTNLFIRKLLLRNATHPESSHILHSRDTQFVEVSFECSIIDGQKKILEQLTSCLYSLDLLNCPKVDRLFYSDLESWRLLARRHVAHTKTVDTFAFLLEGFKNLITYGPRALFLYFKAMRFKHPDVDGVDDVEEFRHVLDRLTTMDFAAFPGATRKTELDCHPKFPFLKKILDKFRADSGKVLVVCSSPFGARAVAEYIRANCCGVLENTTEYFDLMSDSHLLGTPQRSSDEIREIFRSSQIPVLVSTKYVENIGLQPVDAVVAMDYQTATYRFMQMGRKAHALLTEGWETVPKIQRSFDPRIACKVNPSYTFTTFPFGLEIKTPIAVFPVEYVPSNKYALTDDRETLYRRLGTVPMIVMDETRYHVRSLLRPDLEPLSTQMEPTARARVCPQQLSRFEIAIAKTLTSPVVPIKRSHDSDQEESSSPKRKK